MKLKIPFLITTLMITGFTTDSLAQEETAPSPEKSTDESTSEVEISGSEQSSDEQTASAASEVDTPSASPNQAADENVPAPTPSVPSTPATVPASIEDQPPSDSGAAVADPSVKKKEQLEKEPTPGATDSEPEPEEIKAESIDLQELLDLEKSSAGTIGSHGIRLGQLNTSIYVGAYMWAAYYVFEKDDVYLKVDKDMSTFDIHYFNLLVSANIMDRVFPELNLEHEHGYDFKMRTGQLDIRIFDQLIIRAGLFIVPFGYFNEHLANEYMTKVPRRPFVLTNAYIIPSNWSETGLQVRGQQPILKDGNINYAVYVVNGLEQAGEENDAGEIVVAEGGSVRSMRGNFRDKNHNDKAVGGRFGFAPIRGLEFGFSAYSGAYTIDGKQRLLMLAADAHLHLASLTIRTEYCHIQQQTSGADISRQGYWITVAYKVLWDYLEPAVRWDQVIYYDPDNNTRQTFAPEDNLMRLTVGLNYYPFPQKIPLFLIRTAYGFTWNEGESLDNDVFAIQTTIGF